MEIISAFSEKTMAYDRNSTTFRREKNSKKFYALMLCKKPNKEC